MYLFYIFAHLYEDTLLYFVQMNHYYNRNYQQQRSFSWYSYFRKHPFFSELIFQNHSSHLYYSPHNWFLTTVKTTRATQIATTKPKIQGKITIMYNLACHKNCELVGTLSSSIWKWKHFLNMAAVLCVQLFIKILHYHSTCRLPAVDGRYPCLIFLTCIVIL